MGGRIPAQLSLVARLAEHLIAARHHGPDRDVAVLRGLSRELQGPVHVALIGLFGVRGSHRFGSMEAAVDPRYQELFASGSVHAGAPGSMRKLIVITTLVLAAGLVPAAGATAAETPRHNSYVPGELLVRFDGGSEHL